MELTDNLKTAAEWIRDADGILITAGAGIRVRLRGLGRRHGTGSGNREG